MKSVNNLEMAVHREGVAVTKKVAVTNPILALWHTQIGKKVVMAVTGVVLVLFVIAHVVGNLKIFVGPDEINAYSRFLREVGMPEVGYGQVLWVVRIVLLVCVTLHITAAIQLTRMSWAARPIKYNVKRNIETTFAARVMRWGGLLLAVFVVFHLLHLTGGIVGFEPGQFKHLAVYQNVVAAFHVWPVTVFYIVAMAALCLHLSHGIWSMLQTLGWSTARNAAGLKTLSSVIGILVFLGFTSVPVAVLAGWVR
ncbi:MAG TPA: succinate dehydrogenase cytochrome b subunit [Pyrinomonadaceae bacterium]|jgi:succinate dehydrogenase / fumarate reductase, cytochrome b subunit|nr:succinate dehydrogenase cytochrome b subunit [Pyrinomonadaceae bacterium]